MFVYAINIHCHLTRSNAINLLGYKFIVICILSHSRDYLGVVGDNIIFCEYYNAHVLEFIAFSKLFQYNE